MSNRKGCKNQNNNYEVRQRYIPTFVHQQIFEQEQALPHHERCTPTFYSTVLNNEGYNIITTHHKKQNHGVRPNTALQKSVYVNNSHQKRVDDLNPQSHVFYTSRDKWFDHTKQQIMESIKESRNHGYSKQRKYVDLSSDPVFTDFIYGTKGNLMLNASVYNQSKSLVCQKKGNAKSSPENVVDVVIAPTPQVQTLINNEKQVKNAEKTSEIMVQRQKVGQKSNISKKAANESSTRKDFHKKCVPDNKEILKLTGKQVGKRPQSAQRNHVVAQNPTFTVIRRNRIPQH